MGETMSSLSLHHTAASGQEAIEVLRLGPDTAARWQAEAIEDRRSESFDAARMELLQFSRLALGRRLSVAVVASDGQFPSVTVGIAPDGSLLVRTRCSRCGEAYWSAADGDEAAHRCMEVSW